MVSYVVYLRKALWPAGLAAFYPYPAHTIPAWTIGLSGLLLGGVTAAAVFLRRRAPWVVTGWAWYLLAFVPVIGIVQVGSQGRADRYAYLPLIGFWLAVVWSIREPLRRRPGMRRPLLVIGLAANVALAALAVRQLGYWRDTETLFKRALAVTGSNDQAYRVLGEDARRQGRFKEAEGHFREERSARAPVVGRTQQARPDPFRSGAGPTTRRGRTGTRCAAIPGTPRRATIWGSPSRRSAGCRRRKPNCAKRARLPGSRRDLVKSRLLPRATGKTTEAMAAYQRALALNPGLTPAQSRWENRYTAAARADDGIFSNARRPPPGQDVAKTGSRDRGGCPSRRRSARVRRGPFLRFRRL